MRNRMVYLDIVGVVFGIMVAYMYVEMRCG